MNEDILKGLTDDQRKKLEACKSREEFEALAKDELIQLSDEEIEQISGGERSFWDWLFGKPLKCPSCNSKDCEEIEPNAYGTKMARCNVCGNVESLYRFQDHRGNGKD